MLGQRILTAFGLVAVLALVLVVLPRDFAIAALGFIILFGAWEWSQLAGLESPFARGLYLLACGGLMVALWRSTTALADFERTMLLTMLGWIPLFGWIVFAPRRQATALAAIAGLWALVPTWLALARLYDQDLRGQRLLVMHLTA